MKNYLTLFLKGTCMGFADIVPGVSGGTMALVLGIYTKLINAIRSVNLRFAAAFFKALRGGFKREARADLAEAAREANLFWLAVLASGIGVAIIIGSRIIPSLMERYPEVMFAFFFGLVLASVTAPMKMIDRFGGREVALVVLLTIGAFFSVGDRVDPPIEYHTVVVADVEDGGQKLKAIAEAGPSAKVPEEIFWDDQNEALRAAVTTQVEARNLDPKDKTNPYNDIVVPAGTEVHVPAPAYWWVFFAGFVAICAMVLPGVSGSFILLVLGSYYFILNALKGFLRTAAQLALPETQLVYVGLFCVGALLGLIIMTRVLGYLLERAPNPTMAALIGLMLGSLRAIWPFKELDTSTGSQVNVLPSTEVFGNTVYTAGAAFVVGLAIVFGLSWWAGRIAHDKLDEGTMPGGPHEDRDSA